MGAFVHKGVTLIAGTSWTGTAPGGTSTPSGTHSGGTDLTDYIKEATFTAEIEEQDSTNMGSGGFGENVMGLERGTLTITFNDSVTDNELDEIWYGFFRSKVYFDLKPLDASRAAGNPSVICAANVSKYGLGGSVGALAAKQVSLKTTGHWARVTS